MSRLFLAVWPSEETRAHVEEILERLRPSIARQGVRFVRPEKMHLTLRFYGDNMSAEPLVERLSAVRSPSLRLSTGGIGAFPGIQRPRVVWLGIEGDGLAQLHASTCQAVDDLVPPDASGFSPHLTLARVNPGSKEVGRILQSLPSVLTDPPSTWRIDEFTLVETIAGGDYRIVERFKLEH